jgi:hypothetical protein
MLPDLSTVIMDVKYKSHSPPQAYMSKARNKRICWLVHPEHLQQTIITSITRHHINVGRKHGTGHRDDRGWCGGSGGRRQ